MMSDSIWYYSKDRQKSGPLSLDQLKKKRSSGELGTDDLVWAVGWESWKKVGEVSELPPPGTTAVATRRTASTSC